MKLEEKIKLDGIITGQDIKDLGLEKTGSFLNLEFYESERIYLILIRLLSYRNAYQINRIYKNERS